MSYLRKHQRVAKAKKVAAAIKDKGFEYKIMCGMIYFDPNDDGALDYALDAVECRHELIEILENEKADDVSVSGEKRQN